LEEVNKHRFFIGLFLSLLGLGIIMFFGSMKPPANLPYYEWKRLIAPVHLGWMVGAGICVVGLIMIVRDTFLRDSQVNSVEENERALREAILRELPKARMSQEQLNELINLRYSRTGLVGLTAAQMEELWDFIKHQIDGSRN